jgi:hypothetical protein
MTPTSVQHPPVPGVYREGQGRSDGTITDPLTYHRIRVNEALGFDGPLDAPANLLGVISVLEMMPEPNALALSVLRRTRNQILAVRDLCADGDRT